MMPIRHKKLANIDAEKVKYLQIRSIIGKPKVTWGGKKHESRFCWRKMIAIPQDIVHFLTTQPICGVRPQPVVVSWSISLGRGIDANSAERSIFSPQETVKITGN